MTPRKKVLQWIGIGLLCVGVPLGAAFYRCHAVRHMDGHPAASRVVDTPSGPRLYLDDQVCTGDSRKGAGGTDCDLRTIEVSLPDGRKLDTSMGEGSSFHREECRGVYAVVLGGAQYVLAGTPPRLLPGGAPPPAESPTGARMTVFHAPELIGAVGDDALVLDEHGGTMMVARVGTDGVARWKRHLPGECHLVRSFTDVLVLATTAPSHRAVGIDLATGKLRWRVRP